MEFPMAYLRSLGTNAIKCGISCHIMGQPYNVIYPTEGEGGRDREHGHPHKGYAGHEVARSRAEGRGAIETKAKGRVRDDAPSLNSAWRTRSRSPAEMYGAVKAI